MGCRDCFLSRKIGYNVDESIIAEAVAGKRPFYALPCVSICDLLSTSLWLELFAIYSQHAFSQHASLPAIYSQHAHNWSFATHKFSARLASSLYAVVSLAQTNTLASLVLKSGRIRQIFLTPLNTETARQYPVLSVGCYPFYGQFPERGARTVIVIEGKEEAEVLVAVESLLSRTPSKYVLFNIEGSSLAGEFEEDLKRLPS